jgi:hypothetical protein
MTTNSATGLRAGLGGPGLYGFGAGGSANSSIAPPANSGNGANGNGPYVTTPGNAGASGYCMISYFA